MDQIWKAHYSSQWLLIFISGRSCLTLPEVIGSTQLFLVKREHDIYIMSIGLDIFDSLYLICF